MDAPPVELAGWVGSLVLAVGGTALVTRLLGKGDKEAAALHAADADWRAEVKSDLKQLLDGQHQLTSEHAVVKQQIAAYDAKLAAIEKRADAQADAHLRAVKDLREEFTRRRRR